jgi:telomere length regulation protein
MTTQLFETLVFEKNGNVTAFTRLLHQTKSLDQRKILLALLKYLTTKFFDKLDPKTPPSAPVIPAAAGLIEKIVGRDSSGTSHLISWLTSSSGAGIGDGIAVRRAVLAALSSDKETIATIFEKSMAQFGDDLYIRHAPILQQEGKCTNELLCINHADTLKPTLRSYFSVRDTSKTRHQLSWQCYYGPGHTSEPYRIE